MALIKSMMLVTFEKGDTVKQKNNLKKLFEDKGFKIIHEVKMQKTNVVKEWVMMGAIQYGTFESMDIKTGVGKLPEDIKPAFGFNPAGGNE